jgi:hypothetical protein
MGSAHPQVLAYFGLPGPLELLITMTIVWLLFRDLPRRLRETHAEWVWHMRCDPHFRTWYSHWAAETEKRVQRAVMAALLCLLVIFLLLLLHLFAS